MPTIENQLSIHSITITPSRLRDMYRKLLLIRYSEAAIAELVRDEKIDANGELVYDDNDDIVRMKKEVICPCHLCTGEEAVAVGVNAHLLKEDLVFSNHRGHGHYLAKGGSLQAMMDEIFGKSTGCAKGHGGSMHLVDPEHGLLGATPIVASSISHAVGAALSIWMNGTSLVAVSFFGDGATEEGRFYESLNLAAYLKLPIVFICENNLYSSHVRIDNRRAAFDIFRHAEPFGMRGIRADGNNVLEVFDVAGEAVNRARSGRGPTLVEFTTYRIHGHVGANLDLEKGLRNRMEFDYWRAKDPIPQLEHYLLGRGVMDRDEIMELQAEIHSEVHQSVESARRASLPEAMDFLKFVVSDRSLPIPKVVTIPRKDDHDRFVDGDLMSFGDAIREATEQLMIADERIFIIGQGVNSPWYVGNSAKGLFRRFGPKRVIDTPISEDSVTGAAIGAAMAGMYPMVIHPRLDFGLLATEQLLGQAANWFYMTAGQVKVPVVVRLIINRGGQQAAQHSQSLQAIYAHVPGLKVVMPSNAYDAKGLMVAAVLSDDPVIYIDDRWTYGEKMEVPRELYSIPLGKGIVRRVGNDITLVATTYLNGRALEAATFLAKEGISVEVIDPRTIKPLDTEIIFESVQKTGRLFVADSGWDAYGFTAEVSAAVASNPVVKSLKAPVVRFGLPPAPAPMSGPLEVAYFGNVVEMVSKIKDLVRA
jgi:2-oxoisovalerate dehydrogenase E1 component